MTDAAGRRARTQAAMDAYLRRTARTGELHARAKRSTPTPEGRLLRAIQSALQKIPGILVLRNTVGVIRTGGRVITYGLGVGSPDLLVVAPGGQAIWLEVKTETGRLTPAQTAWLERARRLGCTAEVVRSVSDALAVVEWSRPVAWHLTRTSSRNHAGSRANAPAPEKP